MNASLLEEDVKLYFNGDYGSKSIIFQDHPWLIYLLFVIQFVGVVLNSVLVRKIILL